jgi:hypothetical protein
MTTYAKYRILLFSLELTDGKFLRVQGERHRALPTLQQLPWSCDPSATNGSLLWPIVSISPRINKAGVTVREILDSAFRQNFDEIWPGI